MLWNVLIFVILYYYTSFLLFVIFLIKVSSCINPGVISNYIAYIKLVS